MKLSEAMVLGSTVVTLDPMQWLDTSGDKPCGCLQGMAMYATGRRGGFMSDDLIARWPWLRETTLGPAWHRAAWPQPIHSAISGMAARVKAGGLSFDQVVDWVRSIEPSAPAESPLTHAQLEGEDFGDLCESQKVRA